MEKLLRSTAPSAEASAASGRNSMVDLSHLALVEVSGEDAEKFLASQLTNDVPALTAHQTQLSAWCSAQGRVLALLRMYRTPSSYRMLLPADLAEETMKRLRMFVLRAKVKIEDLSPRYVRLGLSGPKAAECLGMVVGQVPTELNAANTTYNGTLLRLPGAVPRFIFVGEAGEAGMIWDKLATDARPAGADSWTLLDIEAGQPQVYAATRDEFIPQTLNLDVLGAVSFSKGCYPGQEIVARLKYRGRLKQRLYPGRAQTDRLPERGGKIVVRGQEAHVGRVVDVAAHPEGGIALLAVLNMESAQSAELHLNTPDGPACRFTMPPYPINEE
ncbi:MAG TPA: folate-binding protein [Gammaproteobacteria bacterium]|nr:folate-binding protein [Gammaproteobacteria bacterium]